ncbi:MAG TPA: neocarzinostatin apoprotein domain-containing protein [Polyangiaceae bacterium]|nr:neocarzinostatin apoprotein domain-containing protein [Polyangiaceae bacterium]
MTITATPTRNLFHGQIVNVVVSNYSAGGSSLSIGLCPAGATSASQCTLDSGVSQQQDYFTYVGAAVMTQTITSEGRSVDCKKAGACVLGVDTFYFGLRSVPLHFRSGALPSPSIAVNPAANLAGVQEVTVTGSGFPPNAYVQLAQCKPSAASPYSNCGNWREVNLQPDGTFSRGYEVQRTYFTSPVGGDAFTCDTPEACVVYAGPVIVPGGTGVWGATTPIRFAPVGSPRPGTLQVTSGTVTAGESFEVSGSGWAAGATLEARVCSTVSDTLDGCDRDVYTPVQLAPGETTFATTFVAPGLFSSFVRAEHMRLADCVAAPGTCSVIVEDIADRANTRVFLPLTIQSPATPHGSVAIDLQSPLVDDLTVRMEGEGWSPNTYLAFFFCQGAGVDDCIPMGGPGNFTDAAGRLHNYRELSSDSQFRPDFDCAAEANRCALVVGDYNAFTSSAVRIPLTFFTGANVDVPSRYEAKWQPLLDQATSVSGLSASQLQRSGPDLYLWFLARSTDQTGTHLPREGTLTVTSSYDLSSYRALSNEAARLDFTLVEFQKTGGLLYAWLLAGMPPLP